MPISPEEAAKANLDSVKEIIAKAVIKIDKELTGGYYGDNSVLVSIEGPLNQRATNEILVIYSRIGWDVIHKRNNTGRNETYETFTFKKTKAQHYDPREANQCVPPWRD